MPNFLVTVEIPEAPKTYLVEGVGDARAARAHVREIMGADIAAPVEVTELPITSGIVTRFETLEAN